MQGHGKIPPIMVCLKLNEKDITMELDTGTTLSIVSEKTYHSLFSPDTAPQVKGLPSRVQNLHKRDPKHFGNNNCHSYKDQNADLNLLVVAGEGPSLLGHDWLSHIKLDWTRLNHV